MSKTADGYRIGVVSRMTGIALATLRVWERRYAAVVPQRTPKGGRLYTREDLARLSLLKSAVDAGHAIGTVAQLDLEALQQRLAAPAKPARTLRVAVAGPSLPGRLQQAAAALALEIVRSADSTAALAKRLPGGGADLVLLEYPGMTPDQSRDVLDLLQHKQPRLLVLTYEFASARVLRALETAGVLALRGPVDVATLVRIAAGCMGIASAPAPEQEPPPRRLSDAQLDRVGRSRSSLRCECPQHLTQLIRSLAGFERYSADCESLDSRDQALHQFLRRISGQCRSQLEQALVRVVEAEGLGAELLDEPLSPAPARSAPPAARR